MNLTWIDIKEGKPPLDVKVLVCGGDLEVAASSAIYTPTYGESCFECDCFEDEMGREPELRSIAYWAFYPEPKNEHVNIIKTTGDKDCLKVETSERRYCVPDTNRKIESLQTRNAELLEAVKKAHEILLHEMDNGRTPSMLQGVGLGYFEDVICGVPHDVQSPRE